MRFFPAQQSGGFTLLELLIALAIFSLIAVMAYGGLATVLEQNILTEESAERLAALQKTYLVLQRDIEQSVPRSIRNEFGDRETAFMGSDTLQFTRGGWNNPARQRRSTLQRIGYRIEEQELVRYAWPGLDRAQDSQPLEQVLAGEIVSMQIRYLATDNEWKDQWPPGVTGGAPGGAQGGGAAYLPRAVEMTLEHEYFGVIVWLFQLPA